MLYLIRVSCKGSTEFICLDEDKNEVILDFNSIKNLDIYGSKTIENGVVIPIIREDWLIRVEDEIRKIAKKSSLDMLKLKLAGEDIPNDILSFSDSNIVYKNGIGGIKFLLPTFIYLNTNEHGDDLFTLFNFYYADGCLHHYLFDKSIKINSNKSNFSFDKSTIYFRDGAWYWYLSDDVEISLEDLYSAV